MPPPPVGLPDLKHPPPRDTPPPAVPTPPAPAVANTNRPLTQPPWAPQQEAAARELGRCTPADLPDSALLDGLRSALMAALSEHKRTQLPGLPMGVGKVTAAQLGGPLAE